MVPRASALASLLTFVTFAKSEILGKGKRKRRGRETTLGQYAMSSKINESCKESKKKSPRPPAVRGSDFSSNQCAPSLVGVVLDRNQTGFQRLTGEKCFCVPNCHNNQSKFSKPTQKPQKSKTSPHHESQRLYTQKHFLESLHTVCELECVSPFGWMKATRTINCPPKKPRSFMREWMAQMVNCLAM